MENIISTSEAAELLSVSEQYIRKLLKTGKLDGQQVGKTWIIQRSSIKNLVLQEKKQEIPDRRCRHKRTNNIIKCLSFFSGAMGLDLGLEQAGIATLLTSEIDNACRKTIALNKPDIGLIGDLRDYTTEQIRIFANLEVDEEIDLIVGGPPCQAFSTAGKRKGFQDERGNVFLHFIDVILELKPKFAVIENVRGLLSAPLVHLPHKEHDNTFLPDQKTTIHGGALLYIINKLRAGGYGVSFNLYNAANFGSPQIRERVVLLCSRDGKKLPYLQPTHSEGGAFGLNAWRTFREALRELPIEPQEFIKFPEKRLRYYRQLTAGQNWRNLPTELQKEALGNSYYAGGGKTGFLRRLAWDKPAPTLVTHPAMPATDLAHPEKDRPLSIQEYKRIQEFPDTWIVAGKLQDQYRQIGNAVPISLGRAIGTAIVSYINNEKYEAVSNFQYSRYTNTDEQSWEKAVWATLKKQSSQQLSLF